MKLEYDVFLSHSSNDLPVVKDIAKQLGSLGIKVWLDTQECTAGTLFQEKIEQGIRNSKSVAVMIGPGKIGNWVRAELRVSLAENVTRQIPIIPVLLPNAPESPDLPLFLKTFIWVDMRKGITDDGIDDLASGITGKPAKRLLLETIIAVGASSSSLVSDSVSHNPEVEHRHLDALAMPIIKRKLHVSSEIIAQDAATSAAIAVKSYPLDTLTLFVPLMVDLRWRRAYAVALKRILKVPETTKQIGDYSCVESNDLSRTTGGMLSAELRLQNQVIIKVDGDSVATVFNVTGKEATSIVDSVNRHGRLGLGQDASLSLFERIKAIEVSTIDRAETDHVADELYRQRDTLIPLLARWGMPGSSWLLPQEENYPQEKSLGSKQQDSKKLTAKESRKSTSQTIWGVLLKNVETIASSNAWSPQINRGRFDHAFLNQLLQQLGSTAAGEKVSGTQNDDIEPTW